MKLNRRTAAAALAAMTLIVPQAYATDWPTRQVTIVTTTAAGGNTDLTARMAAEHLTATFGKPFVVENRPSAGGALASGQVASAAADGYTMLFTPSSAILLAPLVQKMSFDPDKSLTPVTNVGTGSQVIAVNRSLPVSNLAEFLAHAKANPHKLNFAAAGTANISHLAPILLFKRAGVELVMVPSRGEPQAISDLIAGNVNFYFGNASILLAQRDHPAIKLLAVGTAQRLPSAPDLPTASETVPGFVFASWNGFLVPKSSRSSVME
jgi:tripartite-type tricarboxylate transporter receptor subunit TctC